MEKECLREAYPLTIVIISNLVSFLIYLTGAFILFLLSPVLVICYILFILFLEFRLIHGHCLDCYYYGKTCAFGKGRLSSVFFQKGSMERFSQKQISGKDMLPDFLVFIIPLLAGFILLLRDFSWAVTILMIILFLLGFAGNAYVRGQLACRYCKQREIGCPAEKLFEKQKKP